MLWCSVRAAGTAVHVDVLDDCVQDGVVLELGWDGVVKMGAG